MKPTIPATSYTELIRSATDIVKLHQETSPNKRTDELKNLCVEAVKFLRWNFFTQAPKHPDITLQTDK